MKDGLYFILFLNTKIVIIMFIFREILRSTKGSLSAKIEQ